MRVSTFYGMAIINRFILTFSLFLLSCSTTDVRYSLEGKVYQDDLVSVQTAVDLAFAAYLKGCVERSHELGQERVYTLCRDRAKKHVREDIEAILNQKGKLEE